MTLGWMRFLVRRQILLRLLGVGAVLAGLAQLQAVSTPTVQAVGPKAYIGLFGEDAVAVIDTDSRQVIGKIAIPPGPHGLVITPDGRTVFASSDGASTVSVIDTATDRVTGSIEVGQSPHGLAITPDGRLVLAAVFGANQVAAIDVASKQIVGQWPAASPHNIAITPDGRLAYVAAQGQGATALVVLDLASRSQVASVPLDKAPRALNFTPDGKLLAFTEAGLDAVAILDPSTNQVVAEVPVGASPHHPYFAPEGEYGLVVSQGPGELAIFDPADHDVEATISVGKAPHWIATDPDGDTAYVTNEDSGDVSVVDVEHRQVVATIPVGKQPRKIVLQPLDSYGKQSSVATRISSFAFESPITVASGQVLTWTNGDSVAHTVTSDDGIWSSGSIAAGGTYSLTLDQPGTYAYHCSIHPFMTGMVIVQEAAS